MLEDNLLFWGAGTDLKKFIKEASLFQQIFDLDKIFVVDSDVKKWGTEILGVLIHSPKEIEGKRFKKIVISSLGYYEEILDRVSNSNIEYSEIQNVIEYKQQEIIEYQYNKVLSNKKEGRNIPTTFNKEKLVVYTAIIGDYDDLKPPHVIDDGVEYVCFTDQKDIRSDIWNVEYLKSDFTSPKELVRKFKALPHMFFEEYDSSIWIDASIEIKDSLAEMMLTYQKTSDFLLFPHNERICIYVEAAVCVAKHISEKESMINQISHYYNEGYPFNNGLYCGGVIVRNHNIPKVKKTMDDWFADISKYSKRDQISLPYVIEKNGLQIDLIDLNINDNRFLRVSSHKYR